MKSVSNAKWQASVTIDVPFRCRRNGIVWHGHYPYFEIAIARCSIRSTTTTARWANQVVKADRRNENQVSKPTTFGQRIVVTASIKEYEHHTHCLSDYRRDHRTTTNARLTIQVAVDIASQTVCLLPPILLQRLE
jgi:acyl-CoA thioesterase FadM